MARLVGIEYFFTQSAFDEEKADAADIRRAKASLGEDYNPLDLQQKDEDPIRQVQAQAAHRIQTQFERRVLRRTTESKSWEGQSLIKLPKLHEHIALLTLQPFEREIHSHLAEKMRDE
jgi:TATA-binding protein-associated factor